MTGKSVSRRLRHALALTTVCGLVAYGCGSDSDETTVPPGSTTTTSQGGEGGGAGGSVGGGGGAVGGGGSGGGPVEQGYTQYDFVNGGMQVTSGSYRMVYSFGQASMNQSQGQSSGHSLRGGLIASME
jgi:hypothetical protein